MRKDALAQAAVGDPQGGAGPIVHDRAQNGAARKNQIRAVRADAGIFARPAKSCPHDVVRRSARYRRASATARRSGCARSASSRAGFRRAWSSVPDVPSRAKTPGDGTIFVPTSRFHPGEACRRARSACVHSRPPAGRARPPWRPRPVSPRPPGPNSRQRCRGAAQSRIRRSSRRPDQLQSNRRRCRKSVVPVEFASDQWETTGGRQPCLSSGVTIIRWIPASAAARRNQILRIGRAEAASVAIALTCVARRRRSLEAETFRRRDGGIERRLADDAGLFQAFAEPHIGGVNR